MWPAQRWPCRYEAFATGDIIRGVLTLEGQDECVRKQGIRISAPVPPEHMPHSSAESCVSDIPQHSLRSLTLATLFMLSCFSLFLCFSAYPWVC